MKTKIQPQEQDPRRSDEPYRRGSRRSDEPYRRSDATPPTNIRVTKRLSGTEARFDDIGNGMYLERFLLI